VALTAASTVLLVVAVIFAAAFVRSALGFGDAVVAMPLLAVIAGLKTATPLVAFLGPTLAVLILARHWTKVDWRAGARLVAASVVGIPLGIYLLARAPEAPIMVALGAIVLLYGLSGLVRPAARIKGEKPGLTYLTGLVAGVLGGATNTNGPPVVIYGMLRDWPAERFRATLQGYFLPTGLLILLGHGAAGFWTGTVLRLYVFSLPAILLGVWLGDRASRGLAENRFRRLLYISLAGMGTFLILWTAFRPGTG
jgi:uncharacterized membrane protein YfcA